MVLTDETLTEPNIDLRSTEGLLEVLNGADELLHEAEGDIDYLLDLERQLCLEGGHSEDLILRHLIVKAAVSKQRVMELQDPTFLEVIVPVYHEAIRMSPRATSQSSLLRNPLPPDINGEDSLLRKYIELEWLTRGTNLDYKLRVVDDICDHQSGSIAEQLIILNGLQDKCSVHYLEDDIQTAEPGTLKHSAVKTIIEKGESIRGGALCLGFAEAISEAHKAGRYENTIISYVDSDSSYSMTQAGIPLWELKSSTETQAVTASRQHELTYIEPPKETSQTSGRSSGLIRLKQVVGYLRKTVLEKNVPADTQSGFKFFRPEAIEYALRLPNIAHNFSFDTQLLSRIARRYPSPEALKTFGVVLIDCDELTTANNGLTYYYAAKIVSEIAAEIEFNGQSPEIWLLKYMTESIDQYKRIIKLLEDTTSPETFFDSNSREYALLASIKGRIQTVRDTTAVGDYFTPDICAGLVSLLTSISAREVQES